MIYLMRYLSDYYNLLMGQGQTKQEKNLTGNFGSSLYEKKLPEGEKFFGFHNDSNICYALSPLQVLYNIKIFRQEVIKFKSNSIKSKDYVLLALQNLF